ncbi:MAG: hypothetical protein WEA10_00275 [Actinomycetota bacterium]
MRRVVAILALLLAGCAADPIDTVDPRASVAPPLSLDGVVLEKTTGVTTQVDAVDIANEVVHPDDLRAVLEKAGFSSGVQRSFQGGTGAFTRVLARSLAFESADGVAAYLDWFDANAGEEIITAKRITPGGMPDGAVVFEHQPDGCCHNDVPAYLAVWPRGSSVLFLHVGGQRADTDAFVDLVSEVDDST